MHGPLEHGLLRRAAGARLLSLDLHQHLCGVLHRVAHKHGMALSSALQRRHVKTSKAAAAGYGPSGDSTFHGSVLIEWDALFVNNHDDHLGIYAVGLAILFEDQLGHELLHVPLDINLLLLAGVGDH